MTKSPRAKSPGGVSVCSEGEAPAQATPRQSMSIRNKTGSRNSRDPRPIGDKMYASQCARNVVDFLAMRGFGRTLTHDKFLRDPTTKEYFEIFKFLIAQLDPQLEITGKIDVEVPAIMRLLKYPVEVNRSKLQSICGPNTWPQLLAVLDWLIALIQVNDGLIVPVAECVLGLGDSEADCDTDHHLLRTLQENYLEFLSGKDDHSVEERLRQICSERLSAVQGEVERLQDHKIGMETQLQEFRSEHERLLETQAAPKQLEIEADCLRAGIQTQEARAQRAEEEVVEVEAEGQGVLSDLELLQGNQKTLQDQVESQAYSKKDIERLKCERAHLRRMVEDLKRDAERAEQHVWELGIEESRLEEAIDRNARFVNDKAETMEDAMAAVNGPVGQELLVNVDLSEPTDALAALDFGALGARMEKAAEAHGEATRTEEASVHEVSDEQRAVQEELNEKDRETRRLKIRLEQLTRIREEYRVWSDAELDDARVCAEACEDAVRAASICTVAPTQSEKAEVDELRLKLVELRSQLAGDRVLMEQQHLRSQEARELHQQHVQKELRAGLESMDMLREDVERRVEELGGLGGA